ncbi:MAG: HD domain-containing protein [Anaerolineae bacterium]|nr:HD domain-containing protein [Anaerolineae bacterium]
MSPTQETLYQLLAQNTLEMIYFARGKDRQIIGANQATLSNYGYTMEELLQLRLEDLEADESFLPHTRRMTHHNTGGITFETTHYRKDHSELAVEVSLSKSQMEGEEIFVCVARDISARKKAEEEKRASSALTRKQLERVAALYEIEKTFASDLNLSMMINVLLDQITRQLHADATDLLLINPHTQSLEYAAGQGFRSANISETKLRLGDGLASQAIMERRTIFVPNLASQEEFSRAALLSEDKFVAYYGVPLITKGQVAGILEVFERETRPHDAEWKAFLETLASRAAAAIETSRLFENLQRTNLELSIAYDLTIEGWSRGLDLRISEAEGHTRRVTELSIQLAKMMEISDHNLVHIRRGALLHDIGKMGIPDRVLFKAGELTPQEWNVMRMHPVYAYELIYPIKFLRPALDIPYCHHERWDGSGYPRGLKEEVIPLAARIFSVIDVWDSLRADKPYRNGWSTDTVLNYIKEQSGKLFDPDVVEAFNNMMKAHKKKH